MLAQIGDVAFDECPARFTDPVAEQMVDLAFAGALRDVAPLERLRLPNLLVESVEYLTAVMPKREANDAG